MKLSISLMIVVLVMLVSCKEQNMDESESLLPKPISYSFYKGTINHLFPVVQNKSIGIVYEGEWVSIAKIHRDELELDIFPNNDTFSAYGADGFFQKDPDTLFFKDRRFVQMVDWKNKKVLGMFNDHSKSIDNNLQVTKITNYQKGLALSVYYYFGYNPRSEEPHYSFVIDDILNKKRLKEVPLPDFTTMPVFFTPSFVFYQYTTMKDTDQYYDSPWMVLDNRLIETNHPLADLLNQNAKDTAFSVGENMMQVSEELKHALIETYNHVTKKDMLFLATWYNKPSVQPILIDSTVFGSRRLVTSTGNNTMSPSGHWVYFCAESDNNIDNDLHFLIYLDPKLPNGYLPPMKLNIEGTIGCVGWVTNPEGFMLYKNNQLFYYDLSKVKVPVEG